MNKLFIIILIVNLVAACSSPRLFAEPVITKIFETMTPESIPSKTLTRFPTINPLTPRAVAQFFATNEAKFATKQAEILTPQFTPTVYFEYCKGWGDLTSDEKWATCDKYGDPVIFINQSNQTWQFSYKSFYKQNISNPCTELLYTTNDGSYIYFSLSQDCTMTEPWFPSTIGIFRIKLTNGKTDKVLGENYDFQTYNGHTYNVSISPTGKQIAYIVNETPPLTLNILDISTGEKHSLRLDSKYLNGGLFKWSKDGTKLALLLASRPKDENENDLISFAFLDLLKTTSLTIFIHEKEFTWINAQMEVTELGIKVEAYGESPLLYDIKTGVISTISK
jgi:hypothetical protein